MGMMKLVDMLDLGSSNFYVMRVRVPLPINLIYLITYLYILRDSNPHNQFRRLAFYPFKLKMFYLTSNSNKNFSHLPKVGNKNKK